ncbi:MAG: hypothetical protein M3O31_04075 [Acidobacteriota bacterium]|nr:hypothetical protein [Acidobacteriota bacterium]
MFEFHEQDNKEHFSPESGRDWDRVPSIQDPDFSVLEEIGGYYRGVVEGSEERRYEDIRRAINAVYDFAGQSFSKTLVETRAYGNNSSLQNGEDIIGYRVTISYEAMHNRNITDKFIVELSMMYADVDRYTLRTIADGVHKLIVNGLETLPRSQEGIEGYIRDFIYNWKVEHLGPNLSGIEGSGDDDERVE